MAQKVFDARPNARRGGVRRSQLHSRLLQLRRSHGWPRIPHDGVSGSIGETPGCAEQNDQFPSRTRLQSKQNLVGRGICSGASAHRGDVNAGGRQGVRLHQAGYLENSNGLSRLDRLTA